MRLAARPLVEPPGAINQNIFANLFGHSAVEADFPEIIHGEIGQELQHTSQRRERITNQRQSQVVTMGPPVVRGD